MATTEAGAASRRFSMAPTAAGPMSVAAVPVGAAPVVPAYVPPAHVYEEDEDEVEELMRPHQRQIVQAGGSSGSACGICILCTTTVITILATAATFYVANTNKPYTEGSTAYTAANTQATKLVFVPNNTDVEVDGRAQIEEGADDTTSNDGEATFTQST